MVSSQQNLIVYRRFIYYVFKLIFLWFTLYKMNNFLPLRQQRVLCKAAWRFVWWRQQNPLCPQRCAPQSRFCIYKLCEWNTETIEFDFWFGSDSEVSSLLLNTILLQIFINCRKIHLIFWLPLQARWLLCTNLWSAFQEKYEKIRWSSWLARWASEIGKFDYCFPKK